MEAYRRTGSTKLSHELVDQFLDLHAISMHEDYDRKSFTYEDHFAVLGRRRLRYVNIVIPRSSSIEGNVREAAGEGDPECHPSVDYCWAKRAESSVSSDIEKMVEREDLREGGLDLKIQAEHDRHHSDREK